MGDEAILWGAKWGTKFRIYCRKDIISSNHSHSLLSGQQLVAAVIPASPKCSWKQCSIIMYHCFQRLFWKTGNPLADDIMVFSGALAEGNGICQLWLAGELPPLMPKTGGST